MTLLEILVSILCVLVVVSVIITSIFNAKRGKCSCGGCKNCPHNCKNKNSDENAC